MDRFCSECGAPTSQGHRPECPRSRAGASAAEVPGAVTDSVLQRSTVCLKGSGNPAAGASGISGSVVSHSTVDIDTSGEGGAHRGTGGGRIDLKDTVIQRSRVHIDASTHTSIIQGGPSEAEIRARNLEQRRPKYRIARKGIPFSGERLLTAAQVVDHLNTHPSLGVAPQVDVDGSGTWGPVWRVEEILRHPALRRLCTQTLDRLEPDDVEVCSVCGRPFRVGLLNEGRCTGCAGVKHQEPESHPPPGPITDVRVEEMLTPEIWSRVPEGTFLMGSPGDERGRDPDELQHEVRINRDFYVMRLPVSEALFFAVMNQGESGRVSYASVDVSWMEAIIFCNRLSQNLRLPLCYETKGDHDAAQVRWLTQVQGVRLLTEAEWEYACRAGSNEIYYAGVDADSLYRIAAFDLDEPEPLAEREPNAFGLYDMLGTVWEWVWDGRQDYREHAPVDPRGYPDATVRTLRGGSFADLAEDCRCAKRSFARAGYRSDLYGFRIGVTA